MGETDSGAAKPGKKGESNPELAPRRTFLFLRVDNRRTLYPVSGYVKL